MQETQEIWVGKIPWRRECQPAPVFLPGESHGQKSLVGYSPWNRKELDTTEWLQIHTGFPLYRCTTASPTDGHLDHYQVWASANPAATNTCVQLWFEHDFLFLWDKYSEVQLLDSTTVECSVFKLPNCFRVAVQFYIIPAPQQCMNDSVSPHPHQHLVLSLLFI